VPLKTPAKLTRHMLHAQRRCHVGLQARGLPRARLGRPEILHFYEANQAIARPLRAAAFCTALEEFSANPKILNYPSL
jgi:hypothetical protein